MRCPSCPTSIRSCASRSTRSSAMARSTRRPPPAPNIQSVQLVDLDGDGVEEALAFFRSNSEERPLKIYIFQAVEDSYEQVALIEGSGTAIHSISYMDMDGDGVQELIVGWRVNAEYQAVGVYSIRDFTPQLLMEGLYTQYEVLDFDGDGVQEIVLLRSDTNGEPVAEYYDWEEQTLQSHSLCPPLHDHGGAEHAI